jgi:hypothetical protein
LPETAEERAIVVKAFPEVSFNGLSGPMSLNCESMEFAGWPAPISYGEIAQFTLNEKTLDIKYGPGGKQLQRIPYKDFFRREEALEAINRYYGRYMNAVAYQEQKRQLASINTDPELDLVGSAT